MNLAHPHSPSHCTCVTDPTIDVVPMAVCVSTLRSTALSLINCGLATLSTCQLLTLSAHLLLAMLQVSCEVYCGRRSSSPTLVRDRARAATGKGLGASG